MRYVLPKVKLKQIEMMKDCARYFKNIINML